MTSPHSLVGYIAAAHVWESAVGCGKGLGTAELMAKTNIDLISVLYV